MMKKGFHEHRRLKEVESQNRLSKTLRTSVLVCYREVSTALINKST